MTSDQEQVDSAKSAEALRGQVAELERAMRIVLLILLFLTSAPNVALAFSIAPFVGMLTTLFPTQRPFPILTEWFMAYPLWIAVVSLLWPIAGAIFVFRSRRFLQAARGSLLVVVLAGGHFIVSWAAALLPFRKVIQFISGAE